MYLNLSLCKHQPSERWSSLLCRFIWDSCIPFGFCFFESALSFWLSAHLLPAYWLQLCSCLWFLPAPFVPCYLDLDLDSVFDHSFVCRYCTVSLWRPGHDLYLNKQWFLHSPWSVSGSCLRHNTVIIMRYGLEKIHSDKICKLAHLHTSFKIRTFLSQSII